VVLLGATGTGKSATTAWLIERLQRPTLLIAPNKTLAAQLANELREFFPHNAVEYFNSHDDSIKEDVKRLRHSLDPAVQVAPRSGASPGCPEPNCRRRTLWIAYAVSSSPRTDDCCGVGVVVARRGLRCCSLEQIAPCRFGRVGLSFGRWRTN
jgi:hypothetical protein